MFATEFTTCSSMKLSSLRVIFFAFFLRAAIRSGV
jgi:hypothetical protein